MSIQAPFSQGNATTWKAAICSKTIRLTLFSSRLRSKRRARLCLSEETRCHALKMQNSFTGTLRILPQCPEGCDGQDQAAKAGPATGISIFMSTDWRHDGSWGFCWALLRSREQLIPAPMPELLVCLGTCENSLQLMHWSHLMSWLSWNTEPSGSPTVPDQGWKMEEKLISDPRRKETHPLGHGRIGTSVKF